MAKPSTLRRGGLYQPGRRIAHVNDDVVDLGVVYAPSGALVLAMAGFLDY
jgi:hypothetical protein